MKFRTKMEVKMEVYSTDQLQKIVMELEKNYEEGSDLVYETALMILERRMIPSEYVKFCNLITV